MEAKQELLKMLQSVYVVRPRGGYSQLELWPLIVFQLYVHVQVTTSNHNLFTKLLFTDNNNEYDVLFTIN